MPHEDPQFDELTGKLGNLVGSEETKLREQMGDSEYESLHGYIAASREANVDSVRAHSLAQRLKGVWWACAGVSILAVSSGAVVWLVR